MLTNTGLRRQKPSHHTCGKAIRFSFSGYLNLSLKHWLLRVQTCWSMIFLFRIHNHILNDVSRRTQRPCGIFIPFEINLAHEMFYRNIVFAALVWQLVPLSGVDPWSELFNHFLFCFSFILKMNFRVIVQSQIWFFSWFSYVWGWVLKESSSDTDQKKYGFCSACTGIKTTWGFSIF